MYKLEHRKNFAEYIAAKKMELNLTLQDIADCLDVRLTTAAGYTSSTRPHVPGRPLLRKLAELIQTDIQIIDDILEGKTKLKIVTSNTESLNDKAFNQDTLFEHLYFSLPEKDKIIVDEIVKSLVAKGVENEDKRERLPQNC